MFLDSPYGELDPDQANAITNFRIDNFGKLTCTEFRSTGSVLGGQLPIAVYSHIKSDRTTILLIATTVGFQAHLLPSTGGIQLTGPALTDVVYGDAFYFTSWGDYVIATHPVVGMHKLNLIDYTYVEMVDVPVAPRHVTVFANRVIATSPIHQPGRIQWSVKNNSDDWSGIGSGFEDLLASAGGKHDIPWSVWPIDATRALIVRERSIWVMSITGFANAPFKFELLFDDIGTPSPESVAAVPGGIIMMTHNDFVIVRLDGWQSIGTAIRDSIWDINTGTYYPVTKSAFGVYVKRWNEYWVGYYKFNTTTVVGWRYNIMRNAWARYDYIPNAYIEYVGAVDYDTNLMTFDSGTIGIEDLGSAGSSAARVYFPNGTGNLNYAQVDKYGTDGGSLETGEILAGDDLDSLVTVTKVVMHYELPNANGGIVATLDYSTDAGSNWSTFDSATLPTATPTVVHSMSQVFTRTVSAYNLRFRLSLSSGNGLARFRLLRLNIYAMRGEELETVGTS